MIILQYSSMNGLWSSHPLESLQWMKKNPFFPSELMTLPQEKPSILDHGGAVAINRHFHGDVLKRSL